MTILNQVTFYRPTGVLKYTGHVTVLVMWQIYKRNYLHENLTSRWTAVGKNEGDHKFYDNI